MICLFPFYISSLLCCHSDPWLLPGTGGTQAELESQNSHKRTQPLRKPWYCDGSNLSVCILSWFSVEIFKEPSSFTVCLQFVKITLDLFYVSKCFAYMCKTTRCVPGASRDQKRVLSPLELGLRMVVSHHVSAGTWSQVLCSIVLIVPFCSWSCLTSFNFSCLGT